MQEASELCERRDAKVNRLSDEIHATAVRSRARGVKVPDMAYDPLNQHRKIVRRAHFNASTTVLRIESR